MDAKELRKKIGVRGLMKTYEETKYGYSRNSDTIQELINKFKEAKIPIQITIWEGEPVTIQAFDSDGELHKTSGETEIEALRKMEKELL